MSDQPPVTALKKVLKENPDWSEKLVDSISEAKHEAVREGIRDAKKFPSGLEGDNGYYAYLNKMVRWIPREDYPKECFYMLAKFYWLLDQPSGRELQDHREFNDWMRGFANDWGSFLNTPASASGIDTFIKDPAFNAWQYMANPSGWLTFNQFFGREVKQGLRPVAGTRNDDIITSPADSTMKEKFLIDDNNEITIKYTHKYKILDLLAGSPYREEFRNGLFMHAFLGPNDYHRFRAPVRGTVLECRAIQQRVYLDVQIKNGEFTAPDGGGYEFTQTRGLIIFDSPIGLVAVLPIGMAQVSSVNMTAVEGGYLAKGEEFGYFLFGGSDIIMLFQQNVGVEITAAPGIHYNCGMCVGEVVM
jgi:phosphatidylserine decarboxylase precursor